MKSFVISSLVLTLLPAIAAAQVRQFRHAPALPSDPNSSGNRNIGSIRPGTSFFGNQQLVIPHRFNPNSSGVRNMGSIQAGSSFFGSQRRPSPIQGFNPNESGNRNYGHFLNPNESGNRNLTDFRPRSSFFEPQPQPQYREPIRSYPTIPDVTPRQFSSLSRPTYPSVVPEYRPPVRRSFSQLPIVIRCSAYAYGTCSYELVTESGHSYPYRISGGQRQDLTENTAWILRYRPYAGAPVTEYRLRGGASYEFRRVGNSWQCYRAA